MDSATYLPNDLLQPDPSSTYSAYLDSDSTSDYDLASADDSHDQDLSDIAPEEPSCLVQPAPDPLPEPYIINQPTHHNTPPFSFGTQLDLISPKLLHDTVMSPVPQGRKFMCRIVRKNDGVDKRIYPTYELFLEEPTRSRPVFLMRATKKKRSRGSYYAITSDLDNNIGGDNDRMASDEGYGILGKLRSNFLGTAFHVYTNGRNPFSGGEFKQEDDMKEPEAVEKEKGKAKKETKNKNLPVRQELGAVIY
ncbi:Tubby- protein 1, partial [Gamsiella multidivaricata]